MLKRIFIFVVICLLLIGALLASQFRRTPLHVSGFIEADDIRIGSRVGGRVAAVHVAEGDRVSAGAKLVDLEPFDLLQRLAEAQANLAAARAEHDKLVAGYRPEEIAQAQARRDQLAAQLDLLVAGPRPQEIAASEALVESADAQLRLAQLTFDRVKEAFDAGAATPTEMDQAAQRLRAATADLTRYGQQLDLLREGTRTEQIAEARAQLAGADEALKLMQDGYRAEDIARADAAVQAADAAVQAMQKQLDELVIKAPVDGVIEAINLRPGDLAAPNGPVLSMLDLRRLWVRAYVPENRLAIQIDSKVRVSVDTFPDRRFAGHVSFIARQAEFTPSNVQTPEQRSKQVFRIKVDLDEGLDVLRPGMAADVWLDTQKEDG